MTATKDSLTPRPSTGQPTRPSMSRPHAHSVSVGSLNSQHRVSRRKSSSAGVNLAALAAVVKDGPSSKPDVDALGIASPAGKFSSDNGGMNGQYITFKSNHGVDGIDNGSAIIDDGPPLSSTENGTGPGKASNDKIRARRASEGAKAFKGVDKGSPSTATAKGAHAGSDLRCETCGKGYKHGSCLTKHLWEHTPQWEVTSKLFISKHQQVQLLEAASVLVAMNQDGPASTPSNSSAIRDSELAVSSESPAASGSSDPREDDDQADDASSRTSTPSQTGSASATSHPTRVYRPRRQDSYSSVFSRSYQSTSGTSFGASSAPNDNSNGFSYYRQQWTSQPRPMTSGSSRPGTAFSSEEQADLAAAAESLLSCSLGTPSSGPVRMSGDDVPPVPPLPARYTTSPSQPGNRQQLGSHFHHLSNYSNGSRLVDEDQVVEMDGVESQYPSQHYQHSNGYGYHPTSSLHHRKSGPLLGRMDEDEGVFGGMDH